MSKKIKYVEHPVTPEHKKELRDKGFKIVDARFAPEGTEIEKSRVKKPDAKAKPKANA